MAEIIYTNNCFVFKDGKNEKTLIDCSSFLENKSSLPLHSFD